MTLYYGTNCINDGAKLVVKVCQLFPKKANSCDFYKTIIVNNSILDISILDIIDISLGIKRKHKLEIFLDSSKFVVGNIYCIKICTEDNICRDSGMILINKKGCAKGTCTKMSLLNS